MSVFLVVGGDGLIGSALVTTLQSAGAAVLATSRRSTQPAGTISFDLASEPQSLCGDVRVRRAAEAGSLVTLVTAGVTGIKECQENPQRSYLVNVANTISLIQGLLTLGSSVVFISSSAVFSGERPKPTETSRTDPTTAYGRQKAEAEKGLAALADARSGPRSVSTVRITKVVSPKIPLIEDWLQFLQSGRTIEPFRNRMFSPVSLRHAVRSLVAVGRARETGIFHVTGNDDLTYYDFAIMLAESLGAPRLLVRPVDAPLAGGLAQKYSALASTDASARLGLRTQGPQSVIEDLLSGNSIALG